MRSFNVLNESVYYAHLSSYLNVQSVGASLNA